jgi:hypothetical protein
VKGNINYKKKNMPKSIDVTLAEMQMQINNIDKNVTDIKIAQKTEYSTKLELQDVKDDVKELKDNQTKVIWLIVSTVIVEILYFIFRSKIG